MFDQTAKEVLLKEVSSESDLGIIFQCNLKFNDHIKMATNKANKMTRLVKRTFTYLDKPTLFNLYEPLIRYQVDYGNLIWFSVLKKKISE